MLILNAFGQGINTMTLGGLAVAIGSVVDDSIVAMENTYRGLRKNQLAGTPEHPFKVVYDTSVEVRVSVIFSTVIIAVVFAPIFSLTGVEGRIFAPMGVAYLISIFASTFVAMTFQVQLPDGSQQALDMEYDVAGEHYTAFLPSSAAGEYNIAILSDIDGEKVNGRFTFSD
jgi:Cu/Ag efflux pump CusA